MSDSTSAPIFNPPRCRNCGNHGHMACWPVAPASPPGWLCPTCGTACAPWVAYHCVKPAPVAAVPGEGR